MRALLRSPRASARGAGLIETMVGILIGLIVVLVIYNMLAVSESYKRMAVGTSDAQITGMLTQFIIGREAANGGNGISLAGSDLSTCIAAKANAAWPYNRAGAAPGLWRPIPALVRDSGSNDVSDSFVTTYSGSPHVVWSVAFTSDAGPSAPFIVQSPNGFTAPTPAASPYLVVAVNRATGDCEDTVVTAATAADAFGRVTLTHGATAASYLQSVDPAAVLVNLGPLGIATRTLIENWDPTSAGPCGTAVAARGGCQIYTTDLLTAGASRVPVAQNIVLMKIQYGLDMSNPLDGSVDCWTSAIANITAGTGCNPGGVPTDWTPGTLVNATLQDLQRIVAVRIGIVVRNDEPATRAETDPTDSRYNPSLVFATRPPMYLFNCPANDVTCVAAGRITLSQNVVQDGWRYRTFETVIPLRNQIFNDQ
jgi:type IV pilus assembly protein PilW